MWKLNPANCTPAAMTCLTSSSASVGSTPNFDDRSDFAAGLRNASRTSSSMSAGRPANFCASQAFSTTNVRMPAAYAYVDVHGLLDRVRVDAAVHRQAELLQKVDLGTGGDVEPAAADRDRRQHDGMRQRLDRVVQPESRQRRPPALGIDGRPSGAAARAMVCRDVRRARRTARRPTAVPHAALIAETGFIGHLLSASVEPAPTSS